MRLQFPFPRWSLPIYATRARFFRHRRADSGSLVALPGRRAGFFLTPDTRIAVVLSTLSTPILIVPYGKCRTSVGASPFENHDRWNAATPRDSSEARKLGVWGEPWDDLHE